MLWAPYLGGKKKMIFNEEIWKKVEYESPKGERISAILVSPEASKRLYAGFDSNKKRHFLILLNGNDESYQDLQSRGFSVVTRELIIKNSVAKRYVDIICNDNAGHIIFDVMGSEIAEKLDKGYNMGEVIKSVIDKWRNFWGKPLNEFLSHNKIIGLFAELWFLGHWLLPNLNKLEAINRWRGPLLSRHDFEWLGKSVEVKSTTNVRSRIHKIHGIDQLSPPENGELFLFSLRLREEQGGDKTLPDIIALCRGLLKEDIDALSKFENMLSIAGYSPIHDEEYLKFRFRIVDEKLYDVTDEFPRLINESFINGVPSGVGTIEYFINLDGYDNLCVANSPRNSLDFLG